MVDNKVQHVYDLPVSPKIILLVEDDNEISEILVQMISQETPYRVLAVQDGPQALELVKNTQPHLLLLDYGLPTMHGIELYDRLHSIDGLETVPAIMISANVPLQEVRKRGMIFIRKPFDIDKLLGTIHSLIENDTRPVH